MLSLVWHKYNKRASQRTTYKGENNEQRHRKLNTRYYLRRDYSGRFMLMSISFWSVQRNTISRKMYVWTLIYWCFYRWVLPTIQITKTQKVRKYIVRLWYLTMTC